MSLKWNIFDSADLSREAEIQQIRRQVKHERQKDAINQFVPLPQPANGESSLDRRLWESEMKLRKEADSELREEKSKSAALKVQRNLLASLSVILFVVDIILVWMVATP